MTKYATGGTSGKTGSILTLEVPVKGVPQPSKGGGPAPAGGGTSPAAQNGGGTSPAAQNGGGTSPAPQPSSTVRPDYPLLPEDLKAKYLHMKFTVDGEQVQIDLEHLKYHNVGIHPQDRKDTLRAVLQSLIREMQQKENDVLVQMVGEKFATGVPAFAVWPFMGKGSPEQIQAVLKVVGHFGKKRLQSDWPDRGSLSENLSAFYLANFGLDCNGFAGNYAVAIGAPGLTPDTYIPTFAPPGKRRKGDEEILPGDVIIWNPRHIATIQGKRADGAYDIVESSGEPDIKGLGSSIRTLKFVGGDTFHVQKIHSYGPGDTENVWVSTLK